MHSFGNDFIIFNYSTTEITQKIEKIAKKLCHRNLGIGADGILIILPSTNANCRMKILNADGSEANMCGNGIRCLVQFLYLEHNNTNTTFTIETLAGIMHAEIILKQNRKIDFIKIEMGQSIIDYRIIAHPIFINGKKYDVTYVTVGTNHAVIITDKLNIEEINTIGPIISKYPKFSCTVNVNFVKIINSKEVELITWERGVGLSYACGTGACATIVTTNIIGKTGKSVMVYMKLGKMKIELNQDNTIDMIAVPPSTIFTGEILI